MKLILFVAICFLALRNGDGAPRTAVYKFVRCNPEGDQANCVTHQSPEMAWTPDLPAKLPAATAQYLEAEPVDDQVTGEEGVSPDYGSGISEGSGMDFLDFLPALREEGSGESWTKEDMGPNQGGNKKGVWRLFPQSKPAEHELREDHLLL